MQPVLVENSNPLYQLDARLMHLLQTAVPLSIILCIHACDQYSINEFWYSNLKSNASSDRKKGTIDDVLMYMVHVSFNA